jgi:hypothetical protein
VLQRGGRVGRLDAAVAAVVDADDGSTAGFITALLLAYCYVNTDHPAYLSKACIHQAVANSYEDNDKHHQHDRQSNLNCLRTERKHSIIVAVDDLNG